MRGRALLLLFFPAFSFLWMIGWSLYWIGEQRTTHKSVYSSKPDRAPLITGFVGASRGFTLVEPEFDVLLLDAIDEALSALGDSIMQTVYFHVERSFHIKKHEIPYRLGAFTEAVENIFGVGAKFIEILIMKKLHEKVDARFRCNESEEFGLVQYVSEAKRVFQEKNMIKTVDELVECEERVAEI